MGTKRLSRSIIEGGRTYAYAHVWADAMNSFRASERDFLARAGDDLEAWDEHGFPRRRRLRRWQHDKLGAPRRWLRSQRGRRWDDVHAEMRRRFDARTIAGQHILFDHLLAEVDFNEVHITWRRNFRVFVDEDGIVQVSSRRRKGKRQPPSAEPLRRWLDGRRVGQRGACWFFFHPVDDSDSPRYRQGRRFDAEEQRNWESWPEETRRELTLML